MMTPPHPKTTPPSPHPALHIDKPLDEQDLQALEAALDQIPPPFEPLDICALDGYLCGVLVQPQPVPYAQWWPYVLDQDGRALPTQVPLDNIATLVCKRHDALAKAIAQRTWFDPWVFEFDDAATPTQALYPWVAGFALAMNVWRDLLAQESSQILEPLALIYQHLAPNDLEDADDLLLEIASLEPVPDLAEAVQDLVRATLLLADAANPKPPLKKPSRKNTKR